MQARLTSAFQQLATAIISTQLETALRELATVNVGLSSKHQTATPALKDTSATPTADPASAILTELWDIIAKQLMESVHAKPTLEAISVKNARLDISTILNAHVRNF